MTGSPVEQSAASVAPDGATPPPPPPTVQVFQLYLGVLVAQMIEVVTQNDLARHLVAGPRSSAELAQMTGLHEPSLHRVMRALTGFGLFSQQDGRFSLGPLGEGIAQLDSYPWLITAVNELPRTVASGTTGMQLAHGSSFFEFFEDHPKEGAEFDRVMTTFHAGEKEAVADAYDFSTVDTVVDVGGGNGTFMSVVLPRYEQLRGVLFDLPPVIERARSAVAGLGDRCEVVAGDFFQSLPAGHDAYVLSHVIHDWDEERALTILRNCRDAMGPNGKLLLVESVVPPGDDPHPAKMLDMLMLLFTGGMERTEEEYADLLGRARFRLVRVVPTASPVSVIEAVLTEERV